MELCSHAGVLAIFCLSAETNPSSGCGWADQNSNCQFMQALVNAASANGVNYGTYASGELDALIRCAFQGSIAN